MLTPKDIELLKKHFLTKKDLLKKKEFNFIKQDLMTKQEFLDTMQLQNNNILNFKDEIITKIRALRQKTDVNSSFRQKFDNHETRIQHLEKALAN
jgi:hypothetical protein